MLVVAVISVDAYPFMPFSDLTCHLEDTGIEILESSRLESSKNFQQTVLLYQMQKTRSPGR